MSDFSIKLDARFKKLTDALKIIGGDAWLDKETAKALGDVTIEGIKELTRRGISTIQGNGKFKAYKNRKKYPGDRKGATPVNLRLTGDFMNALTKKVVPDGKSYKVEVFYAGDEDLKEQGHREGVNGQPKRPTIPIGNEKLSATINKELADILKQRLVDLITGD